MLMFLNTCAISFETLVGIWIFSKIFPRRKSLQKRHVTVEAILVFFYLLSILKNFLFGVPVNYKIMFAVFCLILLIGYRYLTVRKKSLTPYAPIINSGLHYVELILLLGLLSWNYWECYISLIMVFIGNLFLPLYFFFYYRCNLFSAYVWSLLYAASTQLVRSSYMIYLCGIQSKSIGELNLYSLGGMHTYDAIFLIFLVVVIIFTFVKYFSLDRILHKAFIQYRFQLLFIGVTEALALNYFTDLGYYDIFDQKEVGRVLIIAIILIFLVLVLITGFIKRSLEMENQLLDIRNNSIHQQYRELNASYNLNRRLIHDEKHRLQFLEECLKNNDLEQAQKVICQYRQTIREQTPRTWTCIPTLDFIINMKKAQMDMQSITFRLDAQLEKLPIREDDFIVLLGNLFDNAIEATEKCPPDDRFIALRMKQTGEMFLLTMQNANAEPPKTRGSHFLTSKKDRTAHGLGVESIRHIVKKYDGIVTFSYDAGSFQVKIIIANHI